MVNHNDTPTGGVLTGGRDRYPSLTVQKKGGVNGGTIPLEKSTENFPKNWEYGSKWTDMLISCLRHLLDPDLETLTN